MDVAGVDAGVTGLLRIGSDSGGVGRAAWIGGASRGSDLSSKAAAFGLGGVAPPWREVRMSCAGAVPSPRRKTMLLPVPSSNVVKICSVEVGPY